MFVNRWSETAASNNASVPDGCPEGWTGAQVNNWGRETMAAVATMYRNSAYIEVTYQLATVGAKSLTRASATEIDILACDATAYFTAGRRIKIVGATTDYGFVVSSAFSTDTAVTVSMESGDVPTTPTAIYVHADPTLRSGAFASEGTGLGFDADTVDGYEGADLAGSGSFRNAIINGGFQVWQRYLGVPISCTAGARTYAADRIATTPTGAAVTVDRTTTLGTGARTKYGLLITGASSVTTCTLVSQRIEASFIPAIKRTVTFSALVSNGTGGSLTLSLALATADAADDFTTSTSRLTQALTAIASGTSARLTYTVDISGYTNINNGLRVALTSPNGALSSGAKTITIAEFQIEAASAFTVFDVRNVTDEQERCYRYYWLSGPKADSETGNIVCAFTSKKISSQNQAHGTVIWPAAMRATPTVTVWANGVSGSVYNVSTPGVETGYTAYRFNEIGCRAIARSSTLTNGDIIACNLEADAEL